MEHKLDELNQLIEHISFIPDPRSTINRKHKLEDVIILGLCAIIGDCDNWVEVVDYAEFKEEWFRQYLSLENGIPSHDTFSRVFRLVSPEALQACLTGWLLSSFDIRKDQVIAIDGKTIRRSGETASGRKALHVVSAWATANHVTLGQLATAVKSNEITAIPELLDKLDIAGGTITMDAMGCQKTIVDSIVEKKADYVIGLKGNQGSLLKEAKELFEECWGQEFHGVHQDEYQTSEKGHGRYEERICQVIEESVLTPVNQQWTGLKCYCRMISKRITNGKTSTEERYYVSSLPGEAKRLAAAIRAHWQIENACHWSLDIAFREDENRTRMGWGQENMAAARRFALSLLKNEKTPKRSIKRKRKFTVMDPDYLLKVLFGALEQPL